MAQGKTVAITKQKRVNATTGAVEENTVSSTSVETEVVDNGIVAVSDKRNRGVVT